MSPTQGSGNAGTTAGHAKAPPTRASPCARPHAPSPVPGPRLLSAAPPYAGRTRRPQSVGAQANRRVRTPTPAAQRLLEVRRRRARAQRAEGALGGCRGEHLRGIGKGAPGRPPHAHSTLRPRCMARKTCGQERTPGRSHSARALCDRPRCGAGTGAQARACAPSRERSLAGVWAGGGGRWDNRRSCCSRCAQLAPMASTSTSAKPRSAASSRKSPTRPWSSVRRGEGGQGPACPPDAATAPRGVWEPRGAGGS